MEQRNLFLAIILSVGILFGYEALVGGLFGPPPGNPQQTAQQGQQGAPNNLPQPPGDSRAPTAPGVTAPGVTPATIKVIDRKAVLAQGDRVMIRAPRIDGSLLLTGARFDDLTLTNYRETLDKNSKNIALLSPQGSNNAYFAEFGWVGQDLDLPGPDTVWTANKKVLEAGESVDLTWDNAKGLRFQRTIALDENYMFTITDSVSNAGSDAVTLFPYGLVSRTGTPKTQGFYILHEGPLGVFDGTLSEIDYSDLQEDGKIEKKSVGGWAGITDKYWLAALVPDQKTENQSRFSHYRDNNTDKYQVDYIGGALTAGAGATITNTTHFFAGAKEVALLDSYAEEFGVERFDLAIDFGWFYFLTKPIFYMILFFNHYFGNFGVAILLLTVLIKLILFPLANKSYKAMSRMKKLQPEMKKLQERFGDDKTRMNQELMALYKKEKVNPVSGCLPILVQIPVFFALYKVLFVNIEMRHAPFFGWIQDLSAPDPTTVFNLLGLIPWDPPSFLMIGIWPLIMGVTMWLQQKLNPQPADPVQAKVMMFLPVLFTFLLATFPAGLVIYWAWNNTLSILQQWVIMRRMGVKVS
ncbi:MAG: membrane protein insertase YidC [Rhodospirillales bacterium]|nr:membrane protein insertase YidC [Rhodospirillales bacterium]MCW8970132.1 membrane protein insertase YidC [Rhodospirillales bacterium]MCW9040391.1 membrane protein insertase YidC [Rhodospirillales bacterium]